MMTPKMRDELNLRIRTASRKLFLSSVIPDMCEKEGTPKQEQFLLEAFERELSLREKNKRERLVKRAGFPVFKSFEDYEYSNITIPPALTREELETASFVPRRQNLVLYGPVGTGKTHMAVAAGIKACSLGYRTKFYTVTELVLKLSEARKNGTLEKLRAELKAQELLILDEWGYVPVDRDGSQLLFRVISDSYESKSLILTTNLEFSKWGSVFTDD